MRHKWCVAFDFDGTLLDPGVGSLLRIVKTRIGLSAEDMAVLDGLLARFLDASFDGTTTAEQETEWILTEMDVFIRHGLSPTTVAGLLVNARLRPGAVECLDWLHGLGVPVVIVSFGIRPFIRMVLASHDALDLVAEVRALQLRLDPKTGLYRGWDESTLVLPSTKGDWALRFACDRGVDPGRILGVGDSMADRLLGITRANRFGFAADRALKRKMSAAFGEIAVTDSFGPAYRWLRTKLKDG